MVNGKYWPLDMNRKERKLCIQKQQKIFWCNWMASFFANTYICISITCVLFCYVQCVLYRLYVFVFDKRLNEMLAHIERIINIFEICNYLMKLKKIVKRSHSITNMTYRDQSLVTVTKFFEKLVTIVTVTTVSHGDL